MNSHLLKDKNALIFGAKGDLGSKVAQHFKTAGANIYLSDINVQGELEENELGMIRKLDSLDEQEVANYFSWFSSEGISVDIVINLSSSNPAEYNHGKPTSEVSLNQFLIPFRNNTASQFITAKAAHQAMAENGGVVIFVTSTLAKVGSPFCSALTASHAATEGLMKSLANEWGPQGIRVLGVRSEAMPDSKAIDYTFTTLGSQMGMSREEMQGFIEQQKTALKRLPTTSETANAIVLAASDMASYMTGTMINMSGGHILE